jgi:hypothetical protein
VKTPAQMFLSQKQIFKEIKENAISVIGLSRLYQEYISMQSAG